ncbi:FUSC family protein [Streptomyces sp. NPDC048664]|uniref:FUSC family protein n=1 Tax=Streptomyces sp. NPDC048664 TaxID=3154505 RepID=UPI00342992D3
MRTLGRIRPARALEWLRAHDPEFAATRRAVRTALVLPTLFALCGQVIGSATMATYAAFGSFSMLLLVEFTGPMTQRLRAHLGLAAVWALLICLGTVVAGKVWLAVSSMVVVGFVILFCGVVSSVLAGATNALLLAFVLPVSSPAPLSEIPARLAGAGLAAAASLLAISLLWPRPTVDTLCAPASRVCRAVAAQLRADASRLAGGDEAAGAPACRAAAAEAAAASAELRRAFDATLYRPTGLSAGSRAVVRLVDELTWLCTIVADSVAPDANPPPCDRAAHVVRRAAALALEESARMLHEPSRSPDALRAAFTELRAAMADMERSAGTRLPAHRVHRPSASSVRAFLGTLDLSFRAQELGFATLQITRNVDRAAAAERRSWPDRLLGREPGVLGGPLASARERAAAHLETHSVWLHNSLRGALGLGAAVAVADLTGVPHSFWVLLGTMSVLRSNALSTGQKALRAVGGTVAGSLIGGGLMNLFGHHGAALWVLLPLAVLAAGIAPSVISFAAGQAAFTVTLVILFNVGHDPNWHIALVRIQDIAMGCAVSVVVGLLFWPRGAAVAVDQALAEAYRDSARYLAAAVAYAVGLGGTGAVSGAGPDSPPATASMDAPREQSRRAAASARRLDDTFRTYLAEHGHKRLPLADLTTLVTGVVGLRLAADAVLGIWRGGGLDRRRADRADARLALLGAADRVSDWYRDLASALALRAPAPSPLPRNPPAEAGLAASLSRDLGEGRGQATATAVRLIWTSDHLDVARRLQPGLAAAAEGGGVPANGGARAAAGASSAA